MVRKRKMRQDLEEHGVMLDDNGLEIGRLTLEGNLILDPLAFFLGLEREASRGYGRVKRSWIFRKYGRWGTHAYDSTVDTMLTELMNKHYIEEDKAGYIKITSTIQRLAKDFPPYVTSKQVFAGLENLDE